jgi:thiol-disulfide isomerase/thioredoxin
MRAAALAVVAVALFGCPSKPSPAPLLELMVDPHHVSADAQRAAREAGEAGKRVFIDIHADWCGPCQELKKAFKRPENGPALSKWAVAPVNMDDVPDGPILGENVHSIPYLIKVDADGKADGSIDFRGVDFDDPHMIDAALRDFLQ